MSGLTSLLEQHGYFILFSSLYLEMLALPLPGEFIMTYTGLIVFEGKLHWLLSIMVAGTGAALGMTTSYWIGYRLGTPFFEKYGARVHFGPDKLNSVSKWFQRHGNKVIIIAFFIPGIRHITGYFSGTMHLSFRKYAVYAFAGSFLWVSVFISLGKVLGPKWEKYHHTINTSILIMGLIAAVSYLCAKLYRKNKDKIMKRINNTLNKIHPTISFDR